MTFDRITVDSDTLEGKPCLRGLRISVESVVRLAPSASPAPAARGPRLDTASTATTSGCTPSTPTSAAHCARRQFLDGYADHVIEQNRTVDVYEN